jgi:hypothetical protein
MWRLEQVQAGLQPFPVVYIDPGRIRAVPRWFYWTTSQIADLGPLREGTDPNSKADETE